LKTKKLYLEDSYLKKFQSQVVSISIEEEFAFIELKETLFYPTSGGQNHDTGTLSGIFGEARVIDVIKNDHSIIHKISGSYPKQGEIISGKIDWNRRFTFMQRHTSQHMLSQAFVRVNSDFKTVSVSFNQPLVTVDFEGNPQNDDLIAAESIVNDICYENLPITSFEIPDSELSNFPVRRPPKVKGIVRLVKVGDWELAACGAPPLSSTTQALPIKIIKSEKIKSSLIRVYFLCGREALDDYGFKHSITTTLANSFSSGVNHIIKRVEGLNNELKSLGETNNKLSLELLGYRFKNSVSRAKVMGNISFTHMIFQDHEAKMVKRAIKNVEKDHGLVVLLSIIKENQIESTLIRSSNVDLPMNELVKTILNQIEGRGGGTEKMARFASNSKDMELILKTVETTLANRL
jgi:alanyl-tRNA synthetase